MRVVNHHRQICWYADQVFSDPHPHLFDPQWWQAQKAVIGSSQGRGVTWFVKLDGKHMVLRHYYRGGMVGKLVRDRFWFEGVEGSRAMAEFALLDRLCELGLPVPRPYAARVSRGGPFYRADIILERIRGAKDLVALLKKEAIPRETWLQIGAVLRRFHDAGVYHADLNSHNILIDRDGKVWVIDFDKGAIRAPGSWQQANLERLLRSFNKEAGLHTSFHWVPDNWQSLMEGYSRG
ncbi:3-deoxy-D-manno-octulosonic acid kinase [Aeromonas diversa]|uniref:3-deoxy-D-manno-octulosonic acid kinase n=1 Tax=Aeromonas diversa CDC 2478-85 TaxID=1268237 RepID=N9TYV7_9GAMM|nr:3-deoxy-D-manno-octulosonic acid kinase [Aeromonas diversa]ENY71299.1 3-deoxy-D-manno-octulosonic-acid kinase [Aeromonas diversa CDC 2478-85]